MTQRASSQLSYSARFMQPFMRVLSGYAQTPDTWDQILRSIDPDERVPVKRVHRMLEIAIDATGDVALPLKAGCAIVRGDTGALDYVMLAAPTVQAAFEAAARYIRLLNDALSVVVTTDGQWAEVHLQSTMPVPSYIEDFQLSSYFINCILPLVGQPPELECWFTRSAPMDQSAHNKAFRNTKLRFSAPWSGFRFERARLAQPISTADSNLHEILRAHLERTLAESATSENLLDRARMLIRRELPRGRANAPQIAKELGMSRRTLCRRLEAENTTFSQLLDDTRRELALEHLMQGQLSLSEIAFLLDFAQTAGFHRAFKRWTGTTPSDYRDRQREPGTGYS